MSVSFIDGTLTDAVRGRSGSKFAVFKSLTFTKADGSTEELKKQVTTSEIAPHLQPGASGRFYTYKAFDLKGVHGLRLADGTSVYSYHKANLKIFPILICLALAWIILFALTRDGIPMLGVLMIPLGVVGWIFTSKSIAETRAQFDSDDGVSLPAERTIARAV